MASITKRYIKGRPYYYAVESKRINGKPRLIWQKYLGTAEEIIQSITQPGLPLPIKGKTFNYGGVAALLQIAKKLHLIEIINKVVKKRAQGLSVGEYITLAAINRCLCPKSKRQLGKWYEKTILTRLIPAKKKELTYIFTESRLRQKKCIYLV